MKTDKAMEFDSNKEISDNVGVDSEVQKSDRQKRKPAWLADYGILRPVNISFYNCLLGLPSQANSVLFKPLLEKSTSSSA
jgi:hypothetical protein